jgi:flavin-dependent dehydrogenase
VRDVAVVGAGPAGLTAARILASRGYDVVVLEEHREVGVPVHCTGVLGMDAFSEFPLPSQAILGTAHVATFVAADGSSVSVDAERAEAAVVDRAAFDQALADASRAAGADLRRGARVRTIEAGDAGVVVELDAGARVESRSLILACGANYRFNRQLGLGVPRSFRARSSSCRSTGRRTSRCTWGARSRPPASGGRFRFIATASLTRGSA